MLCDSLGNLALLSGDDQNVAQNKDWAAKRDVLRASPFTISNSLAAYDRWRPQEVLARTEALAAALLAGWGIG